MAIGEPVWELARAFPAQGTWSEEDYLAFEGEGVHIELTDGMIEVLPVPTDKHQALMSLLHVLLRAWAKARGGFAVPAGIRVRVGPGKFREPDVTVLLAENRAKKGKTHWDGADLVVEIVSESAQDHERDYVRKRHDYAAAGVREYWIVDPETETLVVLALEKGAYREHGRFGRGSTARCAMDLALTVDVSALFDEE